MSYRQVRSPRTWVQDWAGACLRFVQSVLGIGSRGAVDFSAWSSWRHQTGRHTRSMPTNVAVVVWFSHWGRYGNPAYWDNWGHVVVCIPGRGYLSSPGSGYGQAWFPNIAAVERYFGAKYVGWTTHLHGVPVVEWVAKNVKPAPKPKPKPAPTPPINTFEEDEMSVEVFARQDNGKDGEWMRVDPMIGHDLKVDEFRKNGNITTFLGGQVTTHAPTGRGWGRTHARRFGNAPSRLARPDYITIQKSAMSHAAETRRALAK